MRAGKLGVTKPQWNHHCLGGCLTDPLGREQKFTLMHGKRGAQWPMWGWAWGLSTPLRSQNGKASHHIALWVYSSLWSPEEHPGVLILGGEQQDTFPSTTHSFFPARHGTCPPPHQRCWGRPAIAGHPYFLCKAQIVTSATEMARCVH